VHDREDEWEERSREDEGEGRRENRRNGVDFFSFLLCEPTLVTSHLPHIPKVAFFLREAPNSRIACCLS
jgi:hypothetical protein